MNEIDTYQEGSGYYDKTEDYEADAELDLEEAQYKKLAAAERAYVKRFAPVFEALRNANKGIIVVDTTGCEE
jgi:hypothetical protein